VLASGLITLARTIPTIITSFRDSVKDFGAGAGAVGRLRTERDVPLSVVLVGSLLLAIFLVIAPGRRRRATSSRPVLIVVFGFFFVTGVVAHHRARRQLLEPDLRA
jgi:uncharacterized oligopeptide transporter (OPT) family protein